MKGSHKTSKAITQRGWCCPFAFFREFDGVSAFYLADMLKVHERQIYTWKAKYSAGQLKCPAAISPVHVSLEYPCKDGCENVRLPVSLARAERLFSHGSGSIPSSDHE